MKLLEAENRAWSLAEMWQNHPRVRERGGEMRTEDNWLRKKRSFLKLEAEVIKEMR